MKYFRWILCIAFLAPGFVGAKENGLVPAQQLVEQAKTQINEIGVVELAAMREKGAIVIDVREPDETKHGVIPGAEIIPPRDAGVPGGPHHRGP